MKIAITGKPFVGKTTVFKALTKSIEERHGTDKPNMGVVKVPDKRIDFLTKNFQPKKTAYAELLFVDFAGFEKAGGASEKQSDNLNHLKTADALAVVCKLFDQEGDYSPARDFEDWESDLLLSDLQTIENRLTRIEKSSKSKKVSPNEDEKKLLLMCKENIESEKPLRAIEFSDNEKKLLSGFQLLSIKPAIVIYNISENLIGKPEEELPELDKLKKKPGITVTTICGEIELEISKLDEDDRQEFMKEMGIQEPGLNKFIMASYELVGLLSFFTVGEDEVKAWTIIKNTEAQKAAGEIHSDIERGFIRAEIISYDDYKNCGSMSEGKRKGLFRLEGKKYIVQDGDIINFRFNV